MMPLVQRNQVNLQWGVNIPMRDGIRLNAILYVPAGNTTPSPVIVTLTPYIAQRFHDVAMSFASHGYPFLSVDVRGRGNSEGEFMPILNEAKDGHDLVEWVARQTYCNGKVAMWGGSSGGVNQWATAGEAPPHLATIVPVAAPYGGVDFPYGDNIPGPYLMHWLTKTWGHASQDKPSDDFWALQYKRFLESGRPFGELDRFVGNPSAIFQRWLEHPHQDSFWDSHNPTPEQYGRMTLPVLTITGSYDADQPGALAHYREHLKHAGNQAQHYLVIGPWDHAGTRTPQAQFLGITCAPQSLVDLLKLHREWYAWTMQSQPKPEFLQRKVTYYVMGAEKWRYSDTLDQITARSEPLFLTSTANPVDVFSAGSLEHEPRAKSEADHYVYDPRDITLADLESTIDPENCVDQRMILSAIGKLLVYHSAPFAKDTEVSGFFRLCAWLAIDQPDTDFFVAVYEIATCGRTMLLTKQYARARFRNSLREEVLIRTKEPLRYVFDRFTFVSRLIKKGRRLRLVVGPANTIYKQRNYNSGGDVSKESIADAKTVTVRLFHDELHPSALYVPYGQPEV